MRGVVMMLLLSQVTDKFGIAGHFTELRPPLYIQDRFQEASGM